MKAIITRFHGPGNVRGSRYSATDLDGNRATVQASDELTMEGNHRAACLALCKKMGWKGTLVEGFIKGGRVYVWRQSGRNCADEVVAV